MDPISPKTLHERDWQCNKNSYDTLLQDRDISTRVRSIATYIRKKHPRRILDAGCGSGLLGHLLRSDLQNVEIHGFDISEYALRTADAYDLAYCFDIDRGNIPEPDGYFDLVVCSEVIEHIYDVNHCLLELKRVLAPSGVIVLTTPNLSYWRNRVKILLGMIPKLLRDERHLHAFNYDYLAAQCKKLGMYSAYSLNENRGRMSRSLMQISSMSVTMILQKGTI